MDLEQVRQGREQEMNYVVKDALGCSSFVRGKKRRPTAGNAPTHDENGSIE